jgi:hypothetical protein
MRPRFGIRRHALNLLDVVVADRRRRTNRLVYLTVLKEIILCLGKCPDTRIAVCLQPLPWRRNL